MPCRDERDEPGWDRGYREGKGDALATEKKLKTMEAIACMLMRVVQDNELAGTLDYAGAGVPEKEVKRWWTQHLLQDAKRRAEELAAAKKKRKAKELQEKANAIKAKMRATFSAEELEILTKADPNVRVWLDPVDDGV